MIGRFLLDLTWAEGEGLGMWYEYLAKLRVLPEEDVHSVLIVGLPEIYGLGVDMLRYALNGRKLTFVDTREASLNRLKKIVDGRMTGSPDVAILKADDLTKLDFGDNQFDLVCNSECLQAYPDKYPGILREMVRISKKHVVCFVSNGYCYAHPCISKLNSFKIRQFKDEVLRIPGIGIYDYGYIDIPPWPSGINVTKKNLSTKIGSGDEVSCYGGAGTACLTKAAARIIPLLVWLERFYFPPIKQLLAHFIYFHIIKKAD